MLVNIISDKRANIFQIVTGGEDPVKAHLFKLHFHIGEVMFTDDQVAALGAGKRAPVRVTIDGHSARLRLAVMGGQNCVGLSKANRAELGVDIGDTVTALIEVDDTPREVEVPAALAEALAEDPVAAQAFEKLAFTHRKEYAVWVAEARAAQATMS